MAKSIPNACQKAQWLLVDFKMLLRKPNTLLNAYATKGDVRMTNALQKKQLSTAGQIKDDSIDDFSLTPSLALLIRSIDESKARGHSQIKV